MNDTQFELALIERKVDNSPVQQRLLDGYVNATALCKAAGKNFADYKRLKGTDDFLKELSSDVGIPITELIQTITGGIPQAQGTWVHPQVAINLAQWASPKFAVLVSKWVFEWMNGNIPKAKSLPYHLQRYMMNRTQIPPTHFSIFNEIVYNLIAPLEDRGYQLPDSMVPDISEGRILKNGIVMLFLICRKWLRLYLNPKRHKLCYNGKNLRNRNFSINLVCRRMLRLIDFI